MKTHNFFLFTKINPYCNSQIINSASYHIKEILTTKVIIHKENKINHIRPKRDSKTLQ